MTFGLMFCLHSNGFSISISSSNQSSANSVKIKFCVFFSISGTVSENCAISSDLPIRNVWTHILSVSTVRLVVLF